MDKAWMRLPRSTDEYRDGVSKFIEYAVAKSGRHHKLLCPCKNCANRFRLGKQQVLEHLVCDGFMDGYTTWFFHGETPGISEPIVESSSNQEVYVETDEMDQLLMDGFSMYDSSNLGSDSEEVSEDESDGDIESYINSVTEGSQELYPGCKTFSRMQFLVKLLSIKNTWRMSNGCFEDVLELFRDALPKGPALPKNFHEAKKYIRAVGLGYNKHDSCKNDCIVFKGQHADATSCPACNTCRWKSVKSGVDGKRVHNVAQKVIRHFPLDKGVMRMFISSEISPFIDWHNEGRTKDGSMRHPADSPAWKHFEAKHKWFSDEPRNLRFGLATDGFSPFNNMNLNYTIWPIILIPYNLPPWMCMKESNFILSVIVPGKKAPGKDIDVYLQLVKDELKELWEHGVLTLDAYIGEKFRVYAALLWTISDWLGRGILSGESLAVCSHCLRNTCSRRLKHGRKTCYLGHRRFLEPNHPFRSDAESFDGSTEFREPPIQPSGHEISEMTKGLEIVYGKLQKENKTCKRKRRSKFQRLFLK
ncbi:uncharacterized protein LOC100844242 isoform X2 [Brachypodium distachyon]|nr:uncharacterized protein LOC100844242 isoform X2 [Brachypodium distachyon]|eukprot:XP_010240303.1 uncharacterized protein LOC100844242 isoform X2 [Brachypodium distachyon]